MADYYRHFKGGKYKLLGIAKDSETLEKMVVYQALYGEGEMWVSPYEMFFGTVERDGKVMQRFTKITEEEGRSMNKVRITAIRKASYPDLMAKYENPIEHACDVVEGQQWISVDGKCPEGMCPEAWKSMREFAEALARGEGNFFDGWMKNPMSAMISCNDGFRPVSFYLEVME